MTERTPDLGKTAQGLIDKVPMGRSMAVSAPSPSERLHRRDQRGRGRGTGTGFAPFWLVRASSTATR